MPKMMLPTECEKGRCNHAEYNIPCMLQERRCLSGECTHFSRNLYCPTALPDVQPAHRTKND